MTPTTTHCEFRGYPNNLSSCYTDVVACKAPTSPRKEAFLQLLLRKRCGKALLEYA